MLNVKLKLTKQSLYIKTLKRVADTVSYVFYCDRLEASGDKVPRFTVAVVEDLVRLVTLEVRLDLREASLNGVAVREVGRVVDHHDIFLPEEFFDDISFVHLKVVGEEAHTLLPELGQQGPEELHVLLSVDASVKTLPKHHASTFANRADHSRGPDVEAAHIHFDVGAPVAELALLHTL